MRNSARQRHGRRFQPTHELALEPDAVRAAEQLAPRGKVLVVREVAGPFGVPDYLVLIGGRDQLEARLELDVPPLLNEIDAGVLAAASQRYARSVEDLSARLGWSAASISRRISPLLRNGALAEPKPGRYIRASQLAPVGRLVAIETKMSNWRRALQQGRTYRLWCESYVLVLPHVSSASLTGLMSLVADDRSGLVVDGRWVSRPHRRQMDPARAMWGSEHLVAALVEARDYQPSVFA